MILNGTRRDLRVVGTALSPEFVFAIAPGGAMPEPDGFAVIWMLEDAVAASYQMEAAFDDVVIDLMPGADESGVLDGVDRILEPYGGLGAVGRSLQQSNYFLSQELQGLEQMADVVPVIFLAVAAFLLNVVLSRLIHLQRGQIAALKALGYADRQIGFHYLKLVSVVVVIGAVAGIALGVWLGGAMTQLYTKFFQFPVLEYRLDAGVALTGVVVSLVAAVAGGLFAVRSVVRLPPAEAMRPPRASALQPQHRGATRGSSRSSAPRRGWSSARSRAARSASRSPRSGSRWRWRSWSPAASGWTRSSTWSTRSSRRR